MTSQVLNFDVESLIREVGHMPAQHRLVPNLKFGEVWLHAQDVALSAVKSRPKDEEYNQMLLKSYVKLLVAAQEIADLHAALRRPKPVGCSSRKHRGLEVVLARTQCVPHCHALHWLCR